MKRYILLILVSILLSSCMKDDGYDPYSIYYVGMGKLVDDNTGYYILTDNGIELYIKSNRIPQYNIIAGERIIVSYNKLNEAPSLSGRQGYGICLQWVDKVLMKSCVTQSFINKNLQHRTDSIGSDPIIVGGYNALGLISDHYLNLGFTIEYDNSSITHDISIVHDDTKISGDTVFLSVHHNAHNDNRTEEASGWISMDLSPFLPVGKQSVPVKLTWTDYGGIKQTYKDSYYLYNTGGMVKEFKKIPEYMYFTANVR